MPPAPHRLPAGWPVPRSKSQPAGRLEGLLRRGIREDCAIVAHGGTLMAIMEKYARPSRTYFDYQVGNGEGFILTGSHGVRI